jgi:hypothetical protein
MNNINTAFKINDNFNYEPNDTAQIKGSLKSRLLGKRLLEGKENTAAESTLATHQAVPIKRGRASTSEEISSTEKLNPEQVDFFTHTQPSEWFPLSCNEEGRIKISLPHPINKTKRLIYVFRNREKNCLLIGKTGGTFASRCSQYESFINNQESEKIVAKKGRSSFLRDIKDHSEHFDVGILYELKPGDDINFFETLFIDFKKEVCSLYNDHRGGGGGLSHDEEIPTDYAIPAETKLFTPEKYYPYSKEEGKIRPQFTPGFIKRMESLSQEMGETQAFAYVVKHQKTSERYIGVTNDPKRRATEHAYKAEYFDPEHDKFDPERQTGLLHKAMGENPDQFAFGVFPLRSMEKIPEGERVNFVELATIDKVEKYIIELKESHHTAHGFNANFGGGGPISNSVKKLTF